MRTTTAAVLLVVASGCVHELTPEERLERSAGSRPRTALTLSELDRLRCNDAAAALNQARSDNQTETERVRAYTTLHDSLKKRSAAFDEAVRSNTDFAYNSGSDISAARDLCNQAYADVRGELDRYLRELIANPTTDELRGGSPVTVPRADFEAQRRAVLSLAPDDRDVLLDRLAASRARLGNIPPAGTHAKKK